MTEVQRSVRIRAFLETWLVVIIIALVVLTIAFGWWAYQVNAVTEFEEHEDTIEVWSESTDYSHSAVVQNETLIWNISDRVSNKPLYYTQVTPELDGTYTYEYTADNGTLSVHTETYLVVRAVEDQEDTSDPFWEMIEPQNSTSTSSLEPGETHEAEFSVNVSEVVMTIGQVEDQLGASEGLVDVRIVSESQMNGTAAGNEVNHSYRSEMPLVVSPTSYRVLELQTISEPHTTDTTEQRPVQPSAVASIGSLLLFAISAGLLVAVVMGGYTGKLECTDEERELLEIQQQREKFAEWITTGSVPTKNQYETMILVDDLEGLVDVAIDTNKRVIEDQQMGVATVLDDEIIYMYIRPDSPARDWMYSQADTTMDEFRT